MKKNIENIEMGMTWLSYIGGAFGILKNAGLWEGSVSELAGATGLAFQFIIHKELCPSSITVYEWDAVHWRAMDRVGIYTDQIAMFLHPGINTGNAMRADAQQKVKESIDKGIGVLTWAPTPLLEFGIICGYDDEQKIFHVIECADKNPDPLLYDNIGKSEVPFLYIQRFHTAVPVTPDKMYRDALIHAVHIWNTPHPNKLYAQGEKAYDNLISSLEDKTYNPFGLTYAVHTYADTHKMVSDFLTKMSETGLFPGIDKIALQYQNISGHFAQITNVLPFASPKKINIDEAKIPEVIYHAKQCKKIETEAMKKLSHIIEE